MSNLITVLSIKQMRILLDKGICLDNALLIWCIWNDEWCDGQIWQRGSTQLWIKNTLPEKLEDFCDKSIPAFTLSDILDILPNKVRLIKRFDGKYSIRYCPIDGGCYSNDDYNIVANTSIDAAYQMLLYCIENNHIKTK